MKNVNPCDLTAIVTAIACTIFKCSPKEELPVIAAIFSQLGDTLDTMIAQDQLCERDVKE